MRRVKRLAKGLLFLLLVAAISGIGWIVVAPPELLRVGSGYAAKIICSNVFLAGRPEGEVLRDDVQAPGHPLLRLMRVSVDRSAARVSVALFGKIAPSVAVFRPGLGCAVVPEGAAFADIAVPPPADSAAARDTELFWPEGEQVQANAAIARLLAREDLAGPGMRAIVVVKDGRIIGERYGAHFSDSTPLLGWSMAKTVNAAVIGRLIAQGRLSLSQRQLLPLWAGDRRAEITLAQLLSMESGLAFNEDYGGVADVTRMLYLEPDMAAFAASLPLAQEPGRSFSYSSGTAVLLSRIWMDRLSSLEEALGFPRRALFEPLGMRSAVMEADAAGTFVGSSYVYATGRDWARFGLLLAQDGVWAGNRLLPEGFVGQMAQPNGASAGLYSRMQTWLGFPGSSTPLAEGGFVLQGHDGQSITVMPKQKLVVVRLGLSPWWTRYQPAALVDAISKALP